MKKCGSEFLCQTQPESDREDVHKEIADKSFFSGYIIYYFNGPHVNAARFLLCFKH